MSLVLYTKDKCQQCKQMKRLLDKNNIEFEARNISESEQFRNEVVDKLKIGRVPILVKDEQVLAVGYEPNVIDKL